MHQLIPSNGATRLLFSEEAEKYTDAKVICKGIEWKVQQSILCTRCPYLEVCFRMGPFKVCLTFTSLSTRVALLLDASSQEASEDEDG
jgi:hypothetical protein